MKDQIELEKEINEILSLPDTGKYSEDYAKALVDLFNSWNQEETIKAVEEFKKKSEALLRVSLILARESAVEEFAKKVEKEVKK